jgi:hypothetical protein
VKDVAFNAPCYLLPGLQGLWDVVLVRHELLICGTSVYSWSCVGLHAHAVAAAASILVVPGCVWYSWAGLRFCGCQLVFIVPRGLLHSA